MRRRDFIKGIAGSATAWPVTAHAQQVRVARVGVLAPALDTVPALRDAYPFFPAELRKLGFEQGRNVVVEYRAIGQGLPQATAAVNELVAWNADVVFVNAVEYALRAAVAARPPIPIVMAAINIDPVAKGFVQSLARPGGNITGLDCRWTEITTKQVEVLQEAFPDRNRLGVLWDAVSADQFEAAERQAAVKGLALRGLKLENSPYEFSSAFRALTQADAQMVLIGTICSRHTA